MAADPVEQFRDWFDQAVSGGQPEPEAMALATADERGRPSARFVLLRGFDHRGFAFYTNRRSRKGRELAAGGHAALAFRWSVVDRQVRVAGPVEEVSDEESDRYFAGRPRGSQLAAVASDQSEVAPSEDEMERRIAALEERYAGTEVPRPAWWGGYRVLPEEIEFWQQGLFRAHDRFRYRRGLSGGWVVERLFP